MLRWRDLSPNGEAFHFTRRTLPLRPTTLHDHDFLEFFWVVSGQGIEVWRDEQRPLGQGDFGVVAAADRHAIVSRSDLTLCNLAFPTDAWDALGERYQPRLADHFGGPMAPRRGRWGPVELRFIEHAAAGLETVPRVPRALDRMLLTLDDLLSRSRSTNLTPPWLMQAIDQPERWRHRGVAGLVETCGYSREHVARCCRTFLGKSPTRWVNDVRLDYAAGLLSQGPSRVTDVCHEAGFSHLGHFHQQFKKRFGLTPRQYTRRQTAAIPSRQVEPDDHVELS